ncbi:diguanylate cyclase [Rhizobium sp. 007]|nr:diguanylate cyclase [Rhizobium sp. 007]
MIAADRDDAMQVAERIRQEVENATLNLSEGATLRLTVGIGGTTSDFSEASLSDLMRKADTCLYEAKRQGPEPRYLRRCKGCVGVARWLSEYTISSTPVRDAWSSNQLR